MRHIGEIKDVEQANLFAAYLLTEGIATKLEAEGDVWEVWVKDEDQLDRASKEFEQFSAAPNSEKYRGSIQRASELLREEERKRRVAQQNIVKVSETKIAQRRGPLTVLLIVLSAFVALMTNFEINIEMTNETYRTLTFLGMQGPAATEAVNLAEGDFDNLGLRLASITRLELWRLITPIFLHFGMFHLIFNMVMLFQLGRLVENRYGTIMFGILVLATAAISNFAQGTVPLDLDGSGPSYDGNFLVTGFGGMSGVVFGLLGFAWMKSTYDRTAGFRLSQSTVMFLLGYMFFCMTPFADAVGLSNVANWAHGIGLVVGMAIGVMPNFVPGSKG